MLSQAMIFPFQDFLTKYCVTSVLHEETEARHLCSFLPLISGQKVVEELPVVLADIRIETSEDLLVFMLLVLLSQDFHQVLSVLLYSQSFLLVLLLGTTEDPGRDLLHLRKTDLNTDLFAF